MSNKLVKKVQKKLIELNLVQYVIFRNKLSFTNLYYIIFKKIQLNNVLKLPQIISKISQINQKNKKERNKNQNLIARKIIFYSFSAPIVGVGVEFFRYLYNTSPAFFKQTKQKVVSFFIETTPDNHIKLKYKNILLTTSLVGATLLCIILSNTEGFPRRYLFNKHYLQPEVEEKVYPLLIEEIMKGIDPGLITSPFVLGITPSLFWNRNVVNNLDYERVNTILEFLMSNHFSTALRKANIFAGKPILTNVFVNNFLIEQALKFKK